MAFNGPGLRKEQLSLGLRLKVVCGYKNNISGWDLISGHAEFCAVANTAFDHLLLLCVYREIYCFEVGH